MCRPSLGQQADKGRGHEEPIRSDCVFADKPLDGIIVGTEEKQRDNHHTDRLVVRYASVKRSASPARGVIAERRTALSTGNPGACRC